MEDSHFEFLKVVTKDFFRRGGRVASSLQRFTKLSITDFEKWLQVELHLYLTGMDKQPHVSREHPVSFHRGKAREEKRQTMKVDFRIRPYQGKNFLLLEVKQASSVQTCITRMFGDMDKVYKGRDSEKAARTLWALGIHSYEGPKSVKDKLSKIDPNLLFHTAKIPGTDLGYTIF